MTYASVMITLELGRSNTRLLNVAHDLAEQFDADVIGIAVSQPRQMIYGEAFVSSGTIEQDVMEADATLEVAGNEFRTAFKSYPHNIEWRAATILQTTADYVARQARCASLVVTGAQSEQIWRTNSFINKGDLVLKAGRPVLIVPEAAESFVSEHILVAWKDTREARRSTLDALPLLKKAAHVTVVEMSTHSGLVDAQHSVDDVAKWMKQQGIHAEPMVTQATEGDTHWLDTIAQRQGADIVVAGAYGHSRLREWVFGGFTRTLLLPINRFSFLSH